MSNTYSCLSSDDILHAPPCSTNQGYLMYRRLVRTIVCASLFGISFCVAIPSSPLLGLFLTQENKKTLIPRIMKDFFYVGFIASAFSYWCVIEPSITNPKAKQGFMPYLGPLSAEIPALSCLIGSHLYYPGVGAIINEVTWQEKRKVFIRMNVKCFFAYAPIHVPTSLMIGASLGLILYPFKLVKLYSYRKDHHTLGSS